MKFLIDECLHTSLVAIAQERGYQATHVNWIGLSGQADWTPLQCELFDELLSDLGSSEPINEIIEIRVEDGKTSFIRHPSV